MYQVEHTCIFMYQVKLLMMYFQPSQLQLLGVHFQRMYMFLWKLNPSDRTIALTKLLIKHAKLQTKETEIGA